MRPRAKNVPSLPRPRWAVASLAEGFPAARERAILRATMRPRTTAACAFVLALAIAPRARAGTFDEHGQFQFDPTAVAREGWGPSTPAQMGVKLISGADAIEGGSYINVALQQNQQQVTFALPSPSGKTRWVVRLFARRGRIIGDVDVDYPDAGAPSFSARLNPTGVVTSDGWYELTTNPFSVDGTRKPKVSLSVSASNADLDALEVVPSGAFKALAQCSLPRDAACGAGEFCATGWCRDGGTFLPPLPPLAQRDAVVELLAGRMRLFFGGRYSRAYYLPVALATLEGAKRASTPWEFWNAWATAVHQLHDWHTQTYGPVGVGGRGAFPICFVEGDADLSHGAAPKDPRFWDVLVSHVGPTANSGLKPGDRVVAVNGKHPIEFVEDLEDLDWGTWRADDPDTHAEAVERLASAVRRWAKTLTIVRCDPQTSTCSAPETIDVSQLPADGNITYPYCDHRPKYHLAQNGPNATTHNSWAGPFHGLLAESQPNEALYGMIWDDVYLTNPNQNPYSASIEEFRANAKGVILDHRLGNGGTENAAEYLTTLFRAPATLSVWPGFNQSVGLWDDLDVPTAQGIFTELSGGGNAFTVGSGNARTTGMPTALLLARDGSASDWFPFGMRGVDNVRIFGRRTAGAFSSFFQFDYYGGMSWRMGSGDIIQADGSTHLGAGVLPHEEIVPKQSDLLLGRDTVFLRALEWIRTCQGCK